MGACAGPLIELRSERDLRPRHPVVHCNHVSSRPRAALLCFRYANLRNVQPRCALGPAGADAPGASSGVAYRNRRTSAEVLCVAGSTWRIILR